MTAPLAVRHAEVAPNPTTVHLPSGGQPLALVLPVRWLSVGVLALVWAAALGHRRVPSVPAALLVAALLLVLGDLALALLRVRLVSAVARTVVAVGAGTAVLLLAGLALNTVGPLVGVDRPLRPVPGALALTLAAAALFAASPRACRLRVVEVSPPSTRVIAGVSGLLLLPLAAAAGAIAVSNGRSPVLTVGVLLASVVVLGICGLRRRTPSMPWAAATVYSVGLALLFMTSLRGAHITGHDIQAEHYVAQLTAQAQRWHGDGLLSDYSACLSITIMPALLAAILHTSTEVVLQVVAQVLFAFCPVAVLLIADRLVGPRRAIAAAALFMAFPTYFTDMSMLVRQETAFLMLAVLVLLIATRGDDPTVSGLRRRRAAVLLVGVGTVLSHYSTTYLLLVQLGVAAGGALLPAAWRRLRPGRAAAGVRRRGADRPVVTVPVVVALAAAAGLWAGVVTHSGGSFVATAEQTIAVLEGHSTSTAASSDASVSLVGGGHALTDQQLIDGYLRQLLSTTPPAQRSAAKAVLRQYPIEAATAERSPLTELGRVMTRVGVSPFATTSAERTGSAWILQLLIGLGVLLVLWRARLGRYDQELALLAVGALLLLAAFVAVPLLTTAYGLLRVFQQGLVVTAVPAVAAIDAGSGVLRGLPRRWRRTSPPTSGAGASGRSSVVAVLVFAVSSTGLIAAATGGYYPPLHLASAGTYYDDYYTPDADLAMMVWATSQPRVRAQGAHALQADLWTAARALSQTGVASAPGILPIQVAPTTFVMLGTTNVERGIATDGRSNVPLTYVYPHAYLDGTKDRVYDNGSAEVYR